MSSLLDLLSGINFKISRDAIDALQKVIDSKKDITRELFKWLNTSPYRGIIYKVLEENEEFLMFLLKNEEYIKEHYHDIVKYLLAASRYLKKTRGVNGGGR